jgi:CheY-like chemotaxis protein/curved DNA-binding protein CbpA
MAKRILLAEENQQMAATIVEQLKHHGFAVEHASDGIAALQSIAHASPDLFLLELKLPGLHGIELVKKLKQSPRTSKLPIIVLTGVYKEEKFKTAAKSLGIQDYLHKPFDTSELIRAIHQALTPTASPAVPSKGESKPFSQHLRAAFQQSFSGLLTLQYPDVVRLLTFINGAPVALRPGFKSLDFGDFLCRRGQISADEYDYFKTTANYRHDSLVQLGCLPYGDLLQAEMGYLDQELQCAFGSGTAQASWKTIPAPELLQLITLNVPQLFYDGFHKHAGDSAGQMLQTFRNKFLLLGEDYYLHINFLRLNESEKQFLQKIDGHQKLVDLVAGEADFGPLLLTMANLNMVRFAAHPAPSTAPADLPLRTLFNLVEGESEVIADEDLESFSDLVADSDVGDIPVTTSDHGNAGFNSAPTEAASLDDDLSLEVRLIATSLEDKTHYEVFGIKQSKFSIALLKDRYFAITRKFGPEVLMQLGGEEAALVEEILSKVATAYDTLTDVVKKERYDELLGADKIGLGHKGDDRFQAQVQAESGKVFLEMEEWDNAEKALQEAVNADPDNGDYLASLAWAIHRNPIHANSLAMQEKTRKMLNKSIAMERTAQAFAYRGWILLEAGRESMAEAELNKALKQDARHALARKGLRTLREQQEQQKKGLFKRMFK